MYTILVQALNRVLSRNENSMGGGWVVYSVPCVVYSGWHIGRGCTVWDERVWAILTNERGVNHEWSERN